MYWSMYVRQCYMYDWLVIFIVRIWCMCSVLSDTKIMHSPLEFVVNKFYSAAIVHSAFIVNSVPGIVVTCKCR
jgi:hypothetical protein